MRRSRTLTSGERWELGLFLCMMVTGCLCVAALVKTEGIPRLFAAVTGTSNSTPAEAPEIEIAESAPEAAPIDVVATKSEITQSVKQQQAPKPVAETKAAAKEDIRYYGGKAYKYSRTIRMRVTGYAPDIRCTWPWPGTTTASGKSVKTNGGKLVAADTRVIPMHSLVVVPGYAGNAPVPVLDRGGAIKGNRLDVLLPTYETALNWGVKYVDVKVYAPVKK